MASDSSAPPSRRPTPFGAVDLDSDTFFSPLPTLHHDPQAASHPVPAAHLHPYLQPRPRSPTSPTLKRVAAPPELVVDDFDDNDACRPYSDADIVVISGGSGYNQLVNATPSATYIMPISDNGGSSSEIIRVLGGPSVGDLRSRLVRLIPLPEQDPHHPTPPQQLPPQHCACAHCGHVNPIHTPQPTVPQSNAALYRLLSYRLPVTGRSSAVKAEWRHILEGTHKLWRGIEHERREAVRGFLVLFDSEILRRSNRKFNFRGGSIGNFFLAYVLPPSLSVNFDTHTHVRHPISAAQKFFRSIQSAIFLFSAVTLINGAGVATGLTFGPFNGGTASAAGTGSRVIPAINTNHTATIAADLRDGETIVGQCEISHPANPSPNPSSQAASASSLVIPQAARYGLYSPSLHGRALLTGGSPSSPAAGTPDRLPQHSHHHHHHHHAHPNPSHPHSLAGSFVFDPSQPGSGIHTPHTPLGLPHAVGSLTGDGLEIQPHGQDGKEGSDEGSSESDSETDNGPASNDVDPLCAPAGHIVHPLAQSISVQDPSPAPTTPGKKEKAAQSNLVFSKDGADEPRLSAQIDRVYYVNAYRNVIAPAPNPGYLAALGQASTLVYSCGSLWTSIVPCVALRGVASAIAHSPTLRRKILLLNSAWDRETDGMTAHDFVHALVDSLNSSDIDAGLLGQGVIGSLGSGVVPPSHHPHPTPLPHSNDPANGPPVAHTWNAFSGEGYAPTDLINWVVYLEHSQVPIEPHDLTLQTGIRTVRISVPKPADGRPPKFTEKGVSPICSLDFMLTPNNQRSAKPWPSSRRRKRTRFKYPLVSKFNPHALMETALPLQPCFYVVVFHEAVVYSRRGEMAERIAPCTPGSRQMRSDARADTVFWRTSSSEYKRD